jgi:patatin-like phospholipase/acyl hydrolase
MSDQNNKNKEFRILSIDGGGIKGIYPCHILKYIDDRIEGSIYEYFDMVVGTSTGSILSLGIGFDKPLTEMCKLYETEGKTIFNKKRIKYFNKGFFKPLYSSKKLKNYLVQFFGEATKLNESKTRICIPYTDVTNYTASVYKTRHSSSYVHDHDQQVWKIALASCSAPIYFPLFDDPNSKSLLADGGLWANNPSLVGLQEALKLGYSMENIKILSLGTGKNIFYKRKFFLKHFGLLFWGKGIIDLILQINSKNSHDVVNFCLKQNYIRVDKDYDSNSLKLDETKKRRIDNIISRAQYDAKTKFETIKNLFFKNKVEKFQPIP